MVCICPIFAVLVCNVIANVRSGHRRESFGAVRWDVWDGRCRALSNGALPLLPFQHVAGAAYVWKSGVGYTFSGRNVSIGALLLVQLQTLISWLLRISLNDNDKLLCLFRFHLPSCRRLKKSRILYIWVCTHRMSKSLKGLIKYLEN